VLLAEGVPTKYIYAIIDSINSLAYGSALLNPQSSADDGQIGPAPTGDIAGLTEVLRAAPRSPDRLFEMQVDALLEGWTTILDREKAKAVPAAKRKSPRNRKRAD
jgi:hypothetical protein